MKNSPLLKKVFASASSRSQFTIAAPFRSARKRITR
jgi:hypothetical protein